MKFDSAPLPLSLSLATALVFLCLTAPTAEAQLAEPPSGNIVWRPDPPEKLFRGELVSDTQVFGWAEAEGLVLGQALKVDMTKPNDLGPDGSYGYDHAVSWWVPQGSTIDVYMLHFDGAAGNSAAACELVFEAKVLGIDFGTRSLRATGGDSVYGGDAVLGNPNTKYPGHAEDGNNRPHEKRGMEATQEQPDVNGNLLRDRVQWWTDSATGKDHVVFHAAVTNRPDEIRIITEPYDPGGPADFEILCTGAAGCPCGNDSAAADQVGCLNSTGKGASLRALGTSDVTANDLAMRLAGLPAETFAIVYLGDGISANPNLLGDGLRCVHPGPNGNGPLYRLGTRYTGPDGTAQFANVIASHPALFQPGTSWGFQGFYRDPHWSACTGAGFNLSNALKVNFR